MRYQIASDQAMDVRLTCLVQEKAAEMLTTPDPKKNKKQGRKVKNFDFNVWDECNFIDHQLLVALHDLVGTSISELI
jgi:hypothetical protein